MLSLNTIEPAIGAKKAAKRLGRGMGSGTGKTSGKGHKGQHARAGNSRKPGFEGGQMPLQRRLPKFGFTSKKLRYSAEIRLFELNKIEADKISIEVLKEKRLISSRIKFVKIILSGKIDRSITIATDVRLTKGAKEAILSAGGKIESVESENGA
jgi:large subunit ribosomal protein L15